MWHFDFLERLDGCEPFTAEHGIAFKGIATKAKGVRVVGKVGFSTHPMIEHFSFLREHATQATPKMTIPSPSVLHFRGVAEGDQRRRSTRNSTISIETWAPRTTKLFTRSPMPDAGTSLQLDETNLAYLCDPEQRDAVRARGEDPDRLPEIYARMINAAIDGRPADMRITMHLCRGNFRSSWIAQGGYEPVADILFNTIGVDGYFMEYDSDRAGMAFEPLRFVPKGKTVVLGLMTSKTGELESKDDIRRRIDQAAQYLDLDQLCLSPQCGFASTEEGNLLTEDQQWAKLRRIVEIADEVWG